MTELKIEIRQLQEFIITLGDHIEQTKRLIEELQEIRKIIKN